MSIDHTHGTVMTDVDHEEERQLFERFHASRERRLRNELIERYMGFAAHIALRFSRGRLDDDIRQAAMFGLVKAVDRFDPTHGSSFTTFAGVTIEGEVKRHFRDKTWAVRVPRRAKELHLLVRDAAEHLAAEHGRSPKTDEIAEYLGVERDDVLRGLSATAAYSVGSIEGTVPDDGDHADAERRAPLAVEERGFGDRIDQHLVDRALEVLPERERRIVELRFYGDMSQSEIAAEVGVSQMHVSRLLRTSFRQMREHLAAGRSVESAEQV